MGIELILVEARAANDFESAFATAATHRPGALVILPAPIMSLRIGEIVGLAMKHHLPAIYFSKEFPQSGGLISYGPNVDDVIRRAAVYVDKILKGANPAELPVEQPTTFELCVNLKTEKALGLTISQSLLAQADEVIE